MFRRILCSAVFSVCFCCLETIAYAEIQSVTITWNEGICDERCGKLVQRRLEGINGVSRVVVSPGRALMYWKPDQKFSYVMIRRPTQLVGVSIDGMYVTVRGTVRRSGNKVTLTSIGDNTKFELTNAPAPKEGTYTQYSSSEMYKLLPEPLELFTKAQKNDQMVTASGFLLMPYRLPLTIVLGNYSIEKEE